MPPVRARRLVIFFTTFVLAWPLRAQDASTGAIRGTVLDPDGRAVGSATVAIVSTTTGLSHSCTTDGEGRFAIELLSQATTRGVPKSRACPRR